MRLGLKLLRLETTKHILRLMLTGSLYLHCNFQDSVRGHPFSMHLKFSEKQIFFILTLLFHIKYKKPQEIGDDFAFRVLSLLPRLDQRLKSLQRWQPATESHHSLVPIDIVVVDIFRGSKACSLNSIITTHL